MIRWNRLLPALLGIAALVFLGVRMVDFAFPGESAALMAAWNGLSPIEGMPHPVMGWLCRLFGGGNLLSPVLGAVSVVLLFLLAKRFFNSSLLALVAAAVFMLSPAVLAASSHLEPRLMDFAVIMAAILLTVDSFKCRRWCRVALWLLAVGLVVMQLISLGYGIGIRGLYRLVIGRYFTQRWMLVFLVSVFPLLPVIALNFSKPKLRMQVWLAHLGLSVMAVLAFASPLSAYKLGYPSVAMPVISSAAVAVTIAYLLRFWFFKREGGERIFALTVGIVFSSVIAFALFFNAITFDRRRGAFADAIAERVLDELGDRRELITSGLLDNHLLLAANRRGLEITCYPLAYERDATYLSALERKVLREHIGGEKAPELALSVRLGLYQFLRDYLAMVPAAAESVAVFGSAKVLSEASLIPVPGFALYGTKSAATVDWGEWDELEKLLPELDQWGSWSWFGSDRIEVLRRALRRYFAEVANDRGGWLMAQGDRALAAKMFILVLDRIDRDNLCALLNLCKLSAAGEPLAVARSEDIERRIRSALKDDRRKRMIDRMVMPERRENFDQEVLAAMESMRAGEYVKAREALSQLTTGRQDNPAVWNLAISLDIGFGDRKAAEAHAKDALRVDRSVPAANYVMGSMALERGEYESAEIYLRKAAAGDNPSPLALNDLAELLRRQHRYEEAVKVARRAVDAAPELYVAWETLGSIMVEQKSNLVEALGYIEKALELSRVNGRADDVRMLVSLAKAQIAIGDLRRAKVALKKVGDRLGELGPFERKEYEDLIKYVN